jgi:hypothetical protein
MLKLGVEQQRASWVCSDASPDTEALNARADQVFTQAMAKCQDAVKMRNSVTVSMGERRQFDLLKLSLER